MNPLFQQLNGNRAQQAPMNNKFGQMMQQFQQFKKSFRGDPKQQVQDLLNSGKMSQEQFNELSQMAKQFQNLFE